MDDGGGGGGPGLTDVRSTQDDLLLDVAPGGYYGHPNPTRGEFVFFGSNPTTAADPDEIPAYPQGVSPDPNYRGAAYHFDRNYSPDGATEYTGSTFGGKLNGRLLVARYSGGDDIVVMSFDAAGGVNEFHTGVAGLTNLADPLDLAEDPRTGFVYVTEFGTSHVTLLRPIAAGAKAELSPGTAPDPQTGAPLLSGPAGTTRLVTLRNAGTTDLALPADALTISGSDAASFARTNKPKLPAILAPGESHNWYVTVTPSDDLSGLPSATLTLKSNDAATPRVDVALRWLVTTGTGGANEPSLQRIFDFHNILISAGDHDPTDVFLTAPPGAGDELLGARSRRSRSTAPAPEPAVRFGTHEPGSPPDGINAGDGAFHECFVVDRADAQFLSPLARGAAAFDPGDAAFALYTVWPGFANHVIYSEDALNAWEPDAVQRHKVRACPLKDATGAVVPDAYVVAFEEFTSGYDFQDFVAVLCNVRAAGGGGAEPEIDLANLDGSPLPGLLAFNRIDDPHPGDGKPDNVVHDTATAHVLNTGAAALVIGALDVRGPWELIDPPTALPITMAPGASFDVPLRFVGGSGRVSERQLVVTNNDPDEPTRTVFLRDYRQFESENGQEPTLAETLRLLGFTTVTAYGGESLDTGGKRQAVGDEILAAAWERVAAGGGPPARGVPRAGKPHDAQLVRRRQRRREEALRLGQGAGAVAAAASSG